MLSRLLIPLSVAFAAAATAAIEGISVTSWAADRSPACSGSSPAEACSLNGFIAMVAGMFFAVETLAAVLVAVVLAQSGKRLGAAVAIAALACALALEHVWLLT